MSVAMNALVVTLDDDRATDVSHVGGKVAGLAALTKAGVRVPSGFALTSSAYRECVHSTALGERIRSIVAGLEGASSDALETAERRIGELFDALELPGSVGDAVDRAYAELGERTGIERPVTAVRSSATAEDTATASFAGEYETLLGVRGSADVRAAVVACWRSVFTRRAMAYALEHGISPADVAMAVVVQKQVAARSAGVMLTLSPVTGDRSRIAIEGSWGLGLAVVGGEVTPDRFVVDKVRLAVLESHIADKHVEYAEGMTARPVDPDRRGAACLSPEECVELAGLGKRLERLLGQPQDIEWAVDRELTFPDSIVLLQCRPETVWSQRGRETAFDADAPVTSWIASRLTSGPSDEGRSR